MDKNQNNAKQNVKSPKSNREKESAPLVNNTAGGKLPDADQKKTGKEINQKNTSFNK